MEFRRNARDLESAGGGTHQNHPMHLTPGVQSRHRVAGDKGAKRKTRQRNALAFGFGVWLIVGSLGELVQRLVRTGYRLQTRAALGMTIAHAGMGVIVLGAVGTGAWNTELMQTMKPGDRATFKGFEIKLDRIESLQGPNYVAERATLAVGVDGKAYTIARNVFAGNSEFAGACFSPDGKVLFVNAYDPTATLAITGPWAA